MSTHVATTATTRTTHVTSDSRASYQLVQPTADARTYTVTPHEPTPRDKAK
jgi:hypothetical protein